MAGLPSQHPTLSLHLADDTLTPLITSSRSRAHLESLTSLAGSALTSHTAAQRVGMGEVERIMVEYPAPAAAAVVLQSYLHVASASAAAASASSSSVIVPTSRVDDGEEETRTSSPGDDGDGDDGDATPADGPGRKRQRDARGRQEEGGEEESFGAAPRLVSVVVAGKPHEASEARKAAARLERVARELQSQWAAGK